MVQAGERTGNAPRLPPRFAAGALRGPRRPGPRARPASRGAAPRPPPPRLVAPDAAAGRLAPRAVIHCFSTDNGSHKTMSPPAESSLLRLAIAKGLLRWEDLDAVAEHLPADGGNGDVSHGRWIRALLEAGMLTEQDVERLAAEL